MAKQRMVNTRFWVDPWVQEYLNSMDRLLFLYFLTNDQTNLSGIYEISMRKICMETGIEKETLVNAMIPRLAPKVYREGNWIILVNFPKHQNTDNPKIMAGIRRELESVPPIIYEKAIAYGYPIALNLTKLNLSVTEKGGDNFQYQPVNDEGEPVAKRKGLKTPTATKETFDFKEELKRLSASPAKVHKIAAHYFTYRKLKFANQDQYEPELARTIKAAKELKGYTGDQIDKTFRHCQKEWEDSWTLETVARWISQVNK